MRRYLPQGFFRLTEQGCPGVKSGPAPGSKIYHLSAARGPFRCTKIDIRSISITEFGRQKGPTICRKISEDIDAGPAARGCGTLSRAEDGRGLGRLSIKKIEH